MKNINVTFTWRPKDVSSDNTHIMTLVVSAVRYKRARVREKLPARRNREAAFEDGANNNVPLARVVESKVTSIFIGL